MMKYLFAILLAIVVPGTVGFAEEAAKPLNNIEDVDVRIELANDAINKVIKESQPVEGDDHVSQDENEMLTELVEMSGKFQKALDDVISGGSVEERVVAGFEAAQSAFRQGNEAATPDQAKALYTKAILHYEKIIGLGGLKRSELYYNLANAYLLKDDVGRAILNYKRAAKLDPSNADILKNLTFARTKRIDAVAIETQKRVLKTLFFWHYDFSIATRFAAAAICFSILFILLTIIVWRGRSTGVVVLCVLAVLLFSAFAGSIGVETLSNSRAKSGVIISPSVIARQGDGTNYSPSFKEPLHAGTEFDLLESRPGWFKIQLSDGSEGWITTNSAEVL